MKHEHRNENTSREELDMLGMRYPRWDKHASIGHLVMKNTKIPFERVVAE